MPLTAHKQHEGIAEAPEGSKDSGALDRITSDRVLALGIFLVCVAYLSLFLRYSTLEPDEGIVLQGAERVLRGEIPYRDFFSFYTPGSFYLIAFVFRIFGDSFLAARFTLAVAGALCSVVTYLLARRVCSRDISLFAAFLATTAGAAFRFLVLHNAYSTLFCCLSLYAALRLLESRETAWAFAAGSLTSLTFLIEQSKGAGLFAGFILALLILGCQSLRKSIWVAVTSGLAWPLLVTLLYFGIHHAVGNMVSDWLWPVRHYTQANHVPYGWQNWSDRSREMIFYTGPVWIRAVKVLAVTPAFVVPALPLLAVGMLFYWSRQSRRVLEGSAESKYYVLVCSVSAGLLASVVGVRADILHFMYLAPVWYIVLAWILGSQNARNRSLLVARLFLVSYVAIAFGLLSMALLFSATGARNRVDTRRGTIFTSREDTVIDYVQKQVKPANSLFVYPYLPLYNYLTATHSPARFDFFQPGMNTPKQAEEIIASLKAKDTSVLFEPWFAEKFANSWPGTPPAAIARDPVADYIVRNYRVCALLDSAAGWRFHYMVPKQSMCP